MIKTQYEKELIISATQSKNGASNAKKDTLKIQSWLNLYAATNRATATAIDGNFGKATETALINYQKANNLPQTGVCDKALFDKLSQPLANAFTEVVTGNDLRTLVGKVLTSI